MEQHFYTATRMGSMTDPIFVETVPGDRDSRVTKFGTYQAAIRAAKLWAARMVSTGAPCHVAYENVRPVGRTMDVQTKVVALLAEGILSDGSLRFIFQVEITWKMLDGTMTDPVIVVGEEVLVRIALKSELVLDESDLDNTEPCSTSLDVHIKRVENEKMIARMAAEREAAKNAPKGKRSAA